MSKTFQNEMEQKAQLFQMIAARMAGNTFPKIAKDHNLTLDKVIYRIKKHSDLMNLFEKTQSGNFSFKDENKTISVKEINVASTFKITGDEKDGVIYTDFSWEYDDTEDSIEIELNNSFKDPGYDELFIPGKLIVGKIIENPPEDLDSWVDKGLYFEKKSIDTKEEISESQTIPEVKVVQDKKLEPIWNASNKFISITVGRDVINANSEHPKFKEALECLFNDDIEKAINLLNVEEAVKKYVKGNILIENGSLYYKGLHLKNGLTNRIVDRMLEGKDFEFYMPFLNNLMLNPSNLAVTRLFDFLEANDIEITKDGYFLAYKKIRSNFTDVYTGTIDNSVGKLVTMDRNLVNDDDEQTCSHGLHVCSKSYLQHFSGEVTVICKVHPRDVVSIPVDYNNAKMRVCRYEVLKQL